LNFLIEASALVPFLTAGLMATGMDWLLRKHPAIHAGNRVEHWILPALTAWVAGIFIYSLSGSTAWWAAYVLAALLLVAVIYAEYVSVESADVRYGLASALLTGLGFALFLLIAIALRTVGVRLLVLLPVLFLSAWLATLRMLNLRLGGRWSLAGRRHGPGPGPVRRRHALLAADAAALRAGGAGTGVRPGCGGGQPARGHASPPRCQRAPDHHADRVGPGGGVRMRPECFRLKSSQWEKMLRHAAAGAPLEVCGLLAGKDGQVQKVFPMRNAAHSKVRFRLDPQEQFDIFSAMEERDLELLGIYHSHPGGPATPSPTDVAEATYPAVNLILSAAGEWRHGY
jgi:proteasome lid subunit RPN8/RPN11